MDEMVCVTLNNSVKMPTLGYTPASSQGDPKEAQQCLDVALSVGYRHIVLGNKDDLDLHIGQQLKRRVESGTEAREDLFISCKINIDDPERANLKSRFVQRLYTIGCEYMDLLLLNIPKTNTQVNGKQLIRPARNMQDNEKDPVCKLWKAVASLQKEGYIRAVGLVCENHVTLLNILQRKQVKPQIIMTNSEDHLVSQHLPKLLQFCRQENLQPIVEVPDKYSCFVTENGRLGTLDNISRKLGRANDQVLVRSFVERGMGVITDAADHQVIDRNFQVYDFSLDMRDLVDLARSDS